MILIVCRHQCIDEMVNDIAESMKLMLKMNVWMLKGYEYTNWYGFVDGECCNREDDEPYCDVDCLEDHLKRIVSTDFEKLISIVKNIAEKYGNIVSFVMITPAPALSIFNVSLISRSIYGVWLRRDIPQIEVEERMYRITTLNLLAKLDPVLAYSFFTMPFIQIDSLIEILLTRKTTRDNLIIEKVHNGYFVAPKNYLNE